MLNDTMQLTNEDLNRIYGGLTEGELELLRNGAKIETSTSLSTRELRPDNNMAHYGHPELGIGLRCQYTCPNGHKYYVCKKNGRGSLLYFCPTCQTFR